MRRYFDTDHDGQLKERRNVTVWKLGEAWCFWPPQVPDLIATGFLNRNEERIIWKIIHDHLTVAA